MKEKIKNALNVVMHKTFDNPDDAIKIIQESIGDPLPIMWNVKSDKIEILIQNEWSIILKLKTHYSVNSALIMQKSKEDKNATE